MLKNKTFVPIFIVSIIVVFALVLSLVLFAVTGYNAFMSIMLVASGLLGLAAAHVLTYCFVLLLIEVWKGEL